MNFSALRLKKEQFTNVYQNDNISVAMWDNESWAARHIRKHGVYPREAWEVVYGDRSIVPISAIDQLTWPPYRRWWTIGETRDGRRLFVVWDQYRHVRNLITAFEPNAERIALYERQKRKKR